MDTMDSELQAQNDYQKALRRAFWRAARQWLGRGCNDLLSYGEVFEYLKNRPHSEPVLRPVPLEQIVGSSGRSHEFDLAFLPRRWSGDRRWTNVARANYQGVELPPVVLYQVGQAYFVEDGNHRVSVARARGDKTIKASVIEIDVSNLKPEPACTRLGYKLDGEKCC